MAKPLVTEEQVFAVADVLAAGGTDPTIMGYDNDSCFFGP